MSDFAARLTMDSPEWYTPMPFVEAARRTMGSIDLDPASHEEANRNVRATRYYCEQENGLRQEWRGNVFLNPPGGYVADFWKRLIQMWKSGSVPQAVWIGYSLEQLQTLQAAKGVFITPLDFPIMFTAKRIAFIENEAKKALRIEKILREGEAAGATDAKRKKAARLRAGHDPDNSPSHSNYVCYLGSNVREFTKEFGEFGRVVVR